MALNPRFIVVLLLREGRQKTTTAAVLGRIKLRDHFNVMNKYVFKGWVGSEVDGERERGWNEKCGELAAVGIELQQKEEEEA